jgi:thiamine-phosphate pyrophosphorylase
MIIAVTDRKISAAPDFFEQVEAIAASRPDMLILREKDVSEAGYRYLAVECNRICSYYGVRFCVNSFIKTASSVNNGRIQISYGSLVENYMKLKMFEEKWVSVHSLSEAVEAERMDATQLIFGNVFETSCKPGLEGKGLEELKEVCDAVSIPVFAIGGIDLRTAGMAIAAGCRGICVRSLLMESKNPTATMDELRKKVGRADRPISDGRSRSLSI